MNRGQGILRRQSGAQAVYELMRAKIISGEFEPGGRLTEPELARTLGVSRTPVREALRLLIAEGLVDQLPTGGSRVAPLDPADIRRVYDIRARLEGLLARDACTRMTQPDLDTLTRLINLMHRLRGDETEVLRIGREFHARIAEIAENRWCEQLLHQIRGHVDRYRSLSTREPGRPDQAVAEHQAIYEALASGDPDRAEHAMRLHVDQSATSAVHAVGHTVPTVDIPDEPSASR
ncbi:GntR family transcriptional regulator [Micromonospora sp. NPDC047740]|uniref:GntR family transcriptional regulator n=1 Tax=Micromonospora sp. NPDC047740 TaxID=3364254 RepID=UPI00371046C7